MAVTLRTQRVVRSVVAFTGVIAGSNVAVSAATYQWNGTTNTSWQTASNWSASPGAPVSGGTTTETDRLNVYNGVNSPLIYTAVEGNTTFDRVVIGSGGAAFNGAMQITGGTFTTRTGGDIISNNLGAGSLTVNGGTYVTSSSLTLNNTANANAVFTVTSGSATTPSINLKSGGATNSIVNLDGGTLAVTTITATAGGTNVFNFNGGTLIATGTTPTYTTNIANVRNGGAIINTNGRTFSLAQPLTHSTILGDAATDGGLTKNGTGMLTITGVNTYTGDTTVNAGTLTLSSTSETRFVLADGDVSNSVTGTGVVNLNGLFRIDVAGLTADSGEWQLVDITTLSETFSATTFSLAFVGGPSFTNEGGGLYTSGDWAFETTTGVLSLTTAVPEPGAIGLAGCGLFALLGRRVRK